MTLNATPSPAADREPVPLIFDTDMCGDCDDVLALGMIHALQSRGYCRLLAVTVSVDNELAAPFVEAVNTFYGRGEIPIGVVGKGGVVEKSAVPLAGRGERRRGGGPALSRTTDFQPPPQRDGGPPQDPGRPASHARW